MSTDDKTPVSRRHMVGSAGVGLAIAAAAPAFAQAPAPSAALQALQDPASKYPRPPFKRQQQP